MIRTPDAHVARTVAMLATLTMMTSPSEAQSVSLGFNPDVWTRLVTVSRSEIVLSAEQSSVTLGGADTVLVEVLEGVTRFIDAADLGAYSVFLQYDSVRARRRSAGALWRSVAAADRQRAAVRALLNDRMHVTSAEFVELPHLEAAVSEMLRGMAGGCYFTLPDTAVRVGSPWMVDVRVSLASLAWADSPIGVLASGEMVSPMTVMLDSLRVRGSDTLAFLTVKGRFTPQSTEVIPRGDGRKVVAQGWLAANVTWSSGWDAFVAGAVRSVLDVELQRNADMRGGSTVRIDVTTQFQVRV